MTFAVIISGHIQNMSTLELWVISFKMVLPAGHNFTKIFSWCSNVSRYLLIAAKYAVGNFLLFLDTKIWKKKLLKVSSFKLQMLCTNLCLKRKKIIPVYCIHVLIMPSKQHYVCKSSFMSIIYINRWWWTNPFLWICCTTGM